MYTHAYAVILAGGRGERFWPLSRASKPKQFISLFDGKPLIRHAVDRLSGLVPPERVVVITSRDLVRQTALALPQMPPGNIVGEPCARDTAAAVALACGVVAARDPEAVVAILTADQLMTDIPKFRRTLADSFAMASQNPVIVTIGIKPTSPATGFGYIEAGEKLGTAFETTFNRAVRFVEKPSLEVAERYLQSGAFSWNAGMFIWRVETMRKAIQTHAAELSPLAYLTDAAINDETLAQSLGSLYQAIPKISVDYAIMEKADNIVVARGEFGWDDVGSWPALAERFPEDAAHNVIIGNAETVDAADNIILSEDRLTAVLGLNDVIVIHAGAATLVCAKNRAQDIKKIVQKIAARKDAADYI